VPCALHGSYDAWPRWGGLALRPVRVAFGAPLVFTPARGRAEREAALVHAVQAAAALHNSTRITPPVDTTVRQFHSRPYCVLGSGRFVDACVERVADARLRALPLVGAIDQLVDSVDLLSEPTTLGAARKLYEAWLG